MADYRGVDMADRMLPEVQDPRLPPRFWKKITRNEDGCWLWTAAINRNGYGRFMDDRKVDRVAHRVAYEALVGPIADRLQLDHLCRVRHCVNPTHVEPVTQAENLRRGETITAKAVAATRCPQDHPYAGDNLYLTPAGSRRCRQCAREGNALRRMAHPELVRQQNREADRRYRARKRGHDAA